MQFYIGYKTTTQTNDFLVGMLSDKLPVCFVWGDQRTVAAIPVDDDNCVMVKYGPNGAESSLIHLDVVLRNITKLWYDGTNLRLRSDASITTFDAPVSLSDKIPKALKRANTVVNMEVL